MDATGRLATSHSRAWKALLLGFAAFALIHAAVGIAFSERLLAEGKSATLAFARGPWTAQGYRVVSMRADSPLAAAGVIPGDFLKFDRQADRIRTLSVDETVGLTVTNAQGTRHLEVRPVPRSSESSLGRLTTIAGWIASALLLTVGFLIGWRRADDFAMRMFSASMLAQTPLVFLTLQPPGALQSALLAVSSYFPLAAFDCFLYFVLAYVGLLRKPWVRRLFIAFVAIDVALATWAIIAAPPSSLPFRQEALTIGRVLAIPSAIVCIAALVAGWWRSTGTKRQRLAWLSISMGAVYVVYAAANVIDASYSQRAREAFELLSATVISVATAGLGYAVLRHRILDFGFAVNRALVYATTSVVLAALFILGAQLANRLLRFEGRADHPVVDAAIAVALALVARQIVRWVDPRVQRIFFRRWHAAAARLQAFRVDRLHDVPSDRLEPELVDALRDYTGTEACALYIGDESRTLHRRISTMEGAPATIAPESPLANALRGDVRPQRLAEGHGTPAVLALPLTAHRRLVGAVLMGPKRDGGLYRPDEIAQLAVSAQQVGVELELRRLKRLEAQVAALG